MADETTPTPRSEMGGSKKAKKEKRTVVHGSPRAASFNNTHVTSPTRGQRGGLVERGGRWIQGLAEGTRSRPQRRHHGGRHAKDSGLRSLDIRVKGPGSGRESAIRALQAAGVEIKSIRDVTPIPHNGCRPPKRRRV